MAKSIYYKKSFMAQFDFRHRFLPEPPIDLEPTPQQVNEANNGLPQFVAYEPMRQNRWLINFPEELDIQPYFIYAAQRPSIILTRGGSHQWEPMTIKFRDPIGPSMTQRLWDLFLGITENTNNLNVHNDIYQERRNRYQQIRQHGLTFDLEMLDPTGVVISKWTIHNSEVERIDFGPLSYESNDIAECSMVVKPRNITLHF